MYCEVCGMPSDFYHEHGNHCLCEMCEKAFNLGYQEKIKEEDAEFEEMMKEMAREAGEE